MMTWLERSIGEMAEEIPRVPLETEISASGLRNGSQTREVGPDDPWGPFRPAIL